MVEHRIEREQLHNEGTSPWSAADRMCDVVMKGGITSGILYPPAVCELARSFHFTAIGGTSAGAIAAAALAAAEYRRRHGSDEGFRILEGLPGELSRDHGLLHLFRPDRSTRRLFGLLTGVLRAGSGPGKAWAALWRLPGLLFPPLPARRFAANGFGVASGMAIDNRDPRDERPPLGEWLADQIDRIAGKPPQSPLTFGDLWSAPEPRVAAGASSSGAVGLRRSIDLRVITTSLTHGRPYSVPFDQDLFFFRPDELRRLFPERIVQFLIDHRRRREGSSALEPLDPDSSYLPLPEGRDLPVVVAARMSLSFPGLFSMVPLWAVDYERGDEQRAVPIDRCWFSDGGLTSNFPLHFFDELVPSRPTFGINLQYTPVGGVPGRKSVARAGPLRGIYLPQRLADGSRDLWKRFDESRGPTEQLLGFLGALFGAAQSWHDNSFLRLPGYRDRVVEIWLDSHEGGFNLDMSPETVADLVERGHSAGAVLRERFATPFEASDPDAPPSPFSWRTHRWTRLRGGLAALAEQLFALRRSEATTVPGEPTLREMLTRESDGPTSYAFASEAHRAAAVQALDRLLELVGSWERELGDDRHGPFSDPPRPPVQLGTKVRM